MKSRNKTALALLAGIGLGALAIQALHAQAKPPAFLILMPRSKIALRISLFLQTAAKEVQAQGGKFIVTGARPEVLAGEPSPNIISISRWENKEDIIRWFNSDAMKPVREAQAKYTLLACPSSRAHHPSRCRADSAIGGLRTCTRSSVAAGTSSRCRPRICSFTFARGAAGGSTVPPFSVFVFRSQVR